MRVLVNALSAESLSGKHVLYGHLQQLARWTRDQHEFHVICNSTTRPVDADFGSNVYWHDAAEAGRGWLRRTLWETTTLPRRIKEWDVQIYFTPSGTVLPFSSVPQVSLAQNPWCLTPAIPKSLAGRCKAMMQGAAYRRAQCMADLMVYNSTHMQQLYRRNACSRKEKRGLIVHQGLREETHAAAAKARDLRIERGSTILCVSVMARWKNCETLLQAVRLLHDRGIAAKLRLIGDWPEAHYRQQIETEIGRLQLAPHVQIEGHVSRDELHAAYRSARVYCLLSRCESFGIPAIEAQAFGTPVVASNSCAMPEIGGSGGSFVDPESASSAAQALERLLLDDSNWSTMSIAAMENADRFRWEKCSRPLLEMFSLAAVGATQHIAPSRHQVSNPGTPHSILHVHSKQGAAQ